MPQMAPMWWTFLMTMTVTMMYITITINYFNFKKSIKTSKHINIKTMNWMW